MEDKKKRYLDYFKHMEEEHIKLPLGGMAWDDIGWHLHDAITIDKLFTLEELEELFPILLG